ncbi:MAG: hypothetical protein A2513_00785 [Sulfurimonas sp. RIFOXYD12_FULL_33_39]|uniref:hypothetical protein n=1 Tax=unclassified Sulfurimonas TaxID=2623549 RepID=UPI0008B77534|nr:MULTISPECIES: hypothetical protein [unclassified Sulfurimonas]OHE04440.1 MAG: hypothetical protein A3G74_04150 [Sulfurimonas sp. RIFCSPLOWO2_12_FULL_34_6]OHE10858.1 MAG: hypothetical protein A2513_00785 [Sulfurimonas sp. RIFOXYD12_FULL_33_39]OHE13372.1 MAG: hypothetical protein A2530_07395 [Sulfurimonas sp. RIFOXYD2_FULL_34_21]DAB27802.1 MAG TPA: hypothetical protein CFH78_05700 [Sulfurimonas sp. UBA10385]
MEADLIIKSIVGLIALLAVLVFMLFLNPNKKVKSKKEAPLEVEVKSAKDDSVLNTDLDALIEILKDKESDEDKLAQAINLIIKHHGKIEKKFGVKSHADFDIYMDIIYKICRHPNTNKDLILGFDRELGRANPQYKQEIGDAIVKGLNSRKV